MNEIEIPTPRTDAEAVRGRSTAFPRASYFVDADFARQLERENAAMRDVIKAAYEAIEESRECVYGEISSWRAVDINLPKSKAAIELLKPYLP